MRESVLYSRTDGTDELAYHLWLGGAYYWVTFGRNGAYFSGSASEVFNGEHIRFYHSGSTTYYYAVTDGYFNKNGTLQYYSANDLIWEVTTRQTTWVAYYQKDN